MCHWMLGLFTQLMVMSIYVILTCWAWMSSAISRWPAWLLQSVNAELINVLFRNVTSEDETAAENTGQSGNTGQSLSNYFISVHFIRSWDFAWNCHSLFKCAQDNSPWSPASPSSPSHMLQTTSCSAVVWSQLHLPSHLPINNLTIYNKSCYCSIINHKLNNK